MESKTSTERYIHNNVLHGEVQILMEDQRYRYGLCIKSDIEVCKLLPALWEMRRHALEHKVRHISLEKANPLLGTLECKDVKKCLDETFAKTNVKVTVCEGAEK
jgi:hypothetical protein